MPILAENAEMSTSNLVKKLPKYICNKQLRLAILQLMHSQHKLL